MTAVRMLLKSCAMPPARIPSESSLLARTRSSMMACWSLMSRKTSTEPMILLARSRMGAALAAISRSAPVRERSILWSGRSTISPAASTWETGLRKVCRVRWWTTLNTVGKGCPTASLCRQPVRSSACLLMMLTRPSMSVAITPSPMDRSVTVSRSFSAASASSACLRPVTSSTSEATPIIWPVASTSGVLYQSQRMECWRLVRLVTAKALMLWRLPASAFAGSAGVSFNTLRQVRWTCSRASSES